MGPVQSTRILIVDDFEPWRSYVRSLLEKRPELRVVGEAEDGVEGVEKAQQLQPDLILLDIGMPRMNGIEAAKRIRDVAPESKILFVSIERSAELQEAALSASTDGYVSKADAGTELLPAVEALRRKK